jgi:hypothetical protein
VLRGYDVDGVLTAGIEPIIPYVVITGRGSDEDDSFIASLRKNALVYMRPDSIPHTPIAIGYFKAGIINELGVEEFYENNVQEAIIIQISCPKCIVHLVGNEDPKNF